MRHPAPTELALEPMTDRLQSPYLTYAPSVRRGSGVLRPCRASLSVVARGTRAVGRGRARRRRAMAQANVQNFSFSAARSIIGRDIVLGAFPATLKGLLEG